MKILVDADSCPVTNDRQAHKSYRVEVPCFLIRTSLRDGYRRFLFGQRRDSVDFALIERARKNDIVITQDYGVASMALTRGESHPSQWILVHA